jgi:hypothetical protein
MSIPQKPLPASCVYATCSGTRLGCRGWRRGWISCAAVRLWFGRGRRPARHLVPDGTDIEDRPLTVHQAGESIPAAIRSVLDRRASNQGGRAQPRARGRGFKRMVEAADQRWPNGWVKGEEARPAAGCRRPMTPPPGFDKIGEEYVRQIVDLSPRSGSGTSVNCRCWRARRCGVASGPIFSVALRGTYATSTHQARRTTRQQDHHRSVRMQRLVSGR